MTVKNNPAQSIGMDSVGLHSADPFVQHTNPTAGEGRILDSFSCDAILDASDIS